MKVQVTARLISNPTLILKSGVEDLTQDEYDYLVIEIGEGFQYKDNGFILWGDDTSYVISSRDLSHISVEIVEK